MSIYQQTKYREVVRAALLQLKEQAPDRYTFQDMARACKMQKTYLSRVLGGKAELSEDQLYLVCEYLHFDEDQRAYVKLLHALERTSVVKRRKELATQVAATQEKHRRTDAHIAARALVAEPIDTAAYHLDPNMILVHVFLTVPRFAAAPAAIAAELGLPAARFAAILAQLERLGLIEPASAGYRVKVEMLHLAAGSPLYKAYSVLQRAKASEQLQKLPPGRDYAFTVAFSANEAVRVAIKDRFLKLLAEVQPLVLRAKAEHVYQMSFDLFPWSE